MRHGKNAETASDQTSAKHGALTKGRRPAHKNDSCSALFRLARPHLSGQPSPFGRLVFARLLGRTGFDLRPRVTGDRPSPGLAVGLARVAIRARV